MGALSNFKNYQLDQMALQGNEIENFAICSLATQVRWLENELSGIYWVIIYLPMQKLLFMQVFFEGEEAIHFGLPKE